MHFFPYDSVMGIFDFNKGLLIKADGEIKARWHIEISVLPVSLTCQQKHLD